ncbi:diguanylate cyclase (GGDEF) domain-containing protein [Geobacter sp. DSM 9736]|nr:diguanylate cyclase (GGDEF) domain-containing protein [Geobacter sp. DSM 9736]
MGAEPYAESAARPAFQQQDQDEWEVADIADLKQQLNEAVFLGRFMGAISATLDPGDICAIASRWLYDYVPYLRIVFALSPKLLSQPLIYSPGVGKDKSIDPTLPASEDQWVAEYFKGLASLSMICSADGEIRCRRHALQLPEELGSLIIYFDEGSSASFSASFLTNLRENFSHALKNALEHSKLKELAMRDGLTGLFNRRAFDEMLDIEARRGELMPVSLLMIDLDDFKQINDTYGHQAGDQVLARFGKILRDNCRGSDLVARYGGEEFAVMLPTTTSSIAFMIAKRLRTKLSETTFVFNDRLVRLTASIGIAYAADAAKPSSDLVRRADQALYRAKKSGKNRTCVYAAKSVELVKKPAPTKLRYAQLQPEFQVRE